MKIRTQESFPASHFVQTADEKSPCRRLHGHTWTVIVTVEGTVAEDGMVIDFRHIKAIIKQLDHKTLIPDKLIMLSDPAYIKNYLIDTGYNVYSIPKVDVCPLTIDSITAENLAEYFLKAIQEETFIGNEITVQVYESENSSAEISS